jgi:NADH-ubiquinone oxidoreductase chain 3
MTSTTFFIIFIPILSIILLFVNLLLAPHNPYQEKDSAFECGFHSFLGQNRTQFSVSFFIFALLFLLFDLEILLVYPYSVSSYTNDAYGLIIMMVFFVLLTLGFIFELGKNALSIDSKQTSLYNNSDSPNIFIFINTLQSGIIDSITKLNKDIKDCKEDINVLKEEKKIINAYKRYQSTIPEDKRRNYPQLDRLKSHYSEYFDEESSNSENEGLSQLKEYIRDELAGLDKQLESYKTTLDRLKDLHNKNLDRDNTKSHGSNLKDYVNVNAESSNTNLQSTKSDTSDLSESLLLLIVDIHVYR